VAWISQLKTVLSMSFLLLSLASYGAWIRRGGAGRYVTSLAACAGALAAKPTAMVAPALMLVMDFWPLGRLAGSRRAAAGRLVLEKVPFLALAAGAATVTMIAQRQSGALASPEAVSLAERLGRIVVSYAWYPARIVWPSGLSLFYPTELGAGAATKIALSAALVIAFGGSAALLARPRPYLPAGLAWYAVALAPVCGLVPFGTQLVADRYAYLSSVGLFVAAAWAAGDAATGRSRATGRVVATAAVVLVLAFSVVTRAQLGMWRDSETLLSRGVARAPENVHALINYGLWLAEAGRTAEALPFLTRAVERVPTFRPGLVNLGWTLARAGRLDEARSRYEEALRLFPEDAALLAELGRVLALLGRGEDAETLLREAVRLDPKSAAAHLLLGTLLHDAGRLREAEPHLETAAALDPGSPQAATALGANLAALGRRQEAVEVLRRAAVAGPAGDRARLELEGISP
jgi:tetratricopeptide (TPR) repeat protein